ncbi:hypothetical protein D0Z70_21335 [Sphingobium terrigena]|uniref:Uncharacterized protein n=1 Tax=Sphingobium terrigena TaxID=2304063 RepID=A0A418YLX9_9SPHN|nr:hypothetical protein D0Z70_21335 [Sphingobium terrigena]
METEQFRQRQEAQRIADYGAAAITQDRRWIVGLAMVAVMMMANEAAPEAAQVARLSASQLQPKIAGLGATPRPLQHRQTYTTSTSKGKLRIWWI